MSGQTPDSLRCDPYPGLRPFRDDESDLFFGRDEQSSELLKRLQRQRFLGVVGASGCGKSSLVRAGMISGLRAGYLANAGARWLIAEMRPGGRPMRRLAEALLTPEVLGTARAGEPDAVEALEAVLRRGPRGIEETLAETPLPERTSLLILVDQFEEIFRFRKEGSPDEADAFVSLLIRAAEQSEFPVYVVLTMRSDYLGDCALFRGLPETLNDSQFLTPRLTREQCRDAIVGPACVCEGVVEPEAVSALLNDIGTEQDQLPLLQHALMRLWEETAPDPDGIRRITLAHYRQVGGLNVFLSLHADAVYTEALPDDEARRVASILFRALSGGDSNRADTRRPRRLDYVAEVAGVSWERVAAVVEVFREEGRNFLMPPPEVPLTPDTVLDITHESLIRQWTRFKDWVAEEARLAARFHQIVLRAREEQEGAGNLLIPPPLQRALQWREEHLGRVWATRYESEADYDLTLDYIQRSQDAWEKELLRLEAEEKRQEEAEEQRKQDEEKRNRTRFLFRYAILGAVLATILLAVTGIVVMRARSETGRAQNQTRIARKETQEAEKATEAAKRAETEAKKAANQAREDSKNAVVAAATATKELKAVEEAKKKAEEAKRKADQAALAAKKRSSEAIRALKREQKNLVRSQESLSNLRATVIDIIDKNNISLNNLVNTIRGQATKHAKDKEPIRAGNTLREGWLLIKDRTDAKVQANSLLADSKKYYQMVINQYKQKPTNLDYYQTALSSLAGLEILASKQSGNAKFAEALTLVKSELDVMEKKGDTAAQIEIHRLLADLYNQSGDTKQKEVHEQAAMELQKRQYGKPAAKAA